ncbi:hypothetical protein A0H81_10053 [Grifola frondosa]|uniref:Uncharacterized protein n=1 Tax=Grifola frondosa TaxID=5627 RepID=A0A1C7M1J1_GRIFR|nr:hypothetical protein A0H81_10053 [Grifola frondosa]
MSDSLPTPTDCDSGRKRSSALELGPRKKSCVQDPLVHHGRHFGRTIHAFCNVQTLLCNGIIFFGDLADGKSEEELTATERRELKVFRELLKQIPHFESRILESSEEEVIIMADLHQIQKGANGARSDDTKGIKGTVIDWITPKGQALSPPIARNSKTGRGFHHERTGALLCPAGLDWSNNDIKEKLRVGQYELQEINGRLFSTMVSDTTQKIHGMGYLEAAKFVFTSPSSVDQEPKATRSGNARIHGMRAMTKASIAYIATQVRFSLTSAAVFSRTDLVTDSERFYNSIVDLLEDPEEKDEVDSLLTWWNRQLFSAYAEPERPSNTNTALAKIRAKRMALKAAAGLAPP